MITPSLPTTEATVYGDGAQRVAIRPITNQIFWLTHCVGDLAKEYYQAYFSTLPDAGNYAGDRIVDYPFSAFLIVGEKSLLIDTCGPKQQTAFLAALEQGLDGRELDYIWISHVELPHAGNASAIKRRYPNAQIVTRAGGENYELHGLQNALTVAPGDVLDLGEHVVEMVDPLFVDHGLSQWLYERNTGLLFTADWGHNLHEPACGHCFKFVREMLATGYDKETMIEDIRVNAWYQFPWLAWTDPDEIADAVADIFERYDVKIFAPSHGNIIREEFAQFIPLLKEGMRRAAAMPFSYAL